jgi:hypothetical protein
MWGWFHSNNLFTTVLRIQRPETNVGTAVDHHQVLAAIEESIVHALINLIDNNISVCIFWSIEPVHNDLIITDQLMGFILTGFEYFI